MAAHATAPLFLHLDLDAFFASVEVLKDPSLRGKPVVVGGEGRRGVVASCSYEARAFGIRSAMPGHQARKLCPHAVFLRGDMTAYAHYSRWVHGLIADAVPVCIAASIDEFYCDLTGLDRFHDPWALATGLRTRIQSETGLPISMGMANSKTLAKIATGMAKPNGELWVQPGTERAWLAPLSIGEIPGAGKQTLAMLSRLDLQTIGHLQAADPTLLTQHLGKMGLVLWHKAQGRPGGPLQTDRVRKSLGHERTFMEDVQDLKQLQRILTRLVEKSGHELRIKDLWASCLTLKLKYADFSQHTHQQAMPPTQTDEAMLDVARQLLRQHYAGRKPLRLIGVRLTGLSSTGGQQSLFNQPQKPKLYTALDAIKAKYGERSLKRASGMAPEKDS